MSFLTGKEVIPVSAKPIKVGNLSNIFAGTELNLWQGVLNFIVSYYYKIDNLLCTYRGVVETLSVSMQTRNGIDGS